MTKLFRSIANHHRLAVNQLRARWSSNSAINTNTHYKAGDLVGKHFEEIRIPVPWGHIAGKWYGPKHVRPLVGIHGWQDNAGTFDTLAPLLPNHLSFLSLDMPGHGLSSWLPDGMVYHSIDYVTVILRIMDEYNWPKISLMGHSMSSANCFIFAALMGEKVDMIIGLDLLKTVTRSPQKIVDNYAERMNGWMKIDKRMRNNSEPPCYEWDQLVEKLHRATENSVDMDKCKYLLNRNIKASQHEPHKYFFSRDSRVKKAFFYAFANDVPLEMARRIKVPHLFIKALQAPYYERKEHYYEVLNVLKENPQFQYFEVEGTHHVHLNEPDKVADIITPFLNKHRPA